MPVQNGTITGAAVLGFRGAVLISSIGLYLKTGMQSTRIATPALMRNVATEFTGKKYPRSRKGLERAYADLAKLMDGKTLDQIGETHVVNATVGGVAADLAE